MVSAFSEFCITRPLITAAAIAVLPNVRWAIAAQMFGTYPTEADLMSMVLMFGLLAVVLTEARKMVIAMVTARMQG